MTNLFTYGSLMFESVWQVVVGKEFRSEEGLLYGFSIYKVKGEAYPGIVRSSADGFVQGLIYYEVDDISMHRLDKFEGEYYCREPVVVKTGISKEEQCHTYVIKSEYHDVLDSEKWSTNWFKKHGLRRFLETYKGFHAI